MYYNGSYIDAYDYRIPVESLLGKTITSIERDDKDGERLIFRTTENETYIMLHEQDCCEDVRIEDIAGDLDDLLNHPLTMAEEVTRSGESQDDPEFNHTDYSYTWTFYKFATIKGYVNIRWYGSSNGYYSEAVDVIKLPINHGEEE